MDEKPQETLKSIDSTISHQSYAVRTLAVLAIFYTLYFVSSLLVPTFLAFLLYFLMFPIVKFLSKKCHIPAAVGSAFIILVFLIIVGYGFYFLSIQAQGWTNKGHEIIGALNERITAITTLLKKPMEVFTSITKDIEQSLNLSMHSNEPANGPANLFSIIFSNTWTFLTQFFAMLIILYFLLASKNFFLTKVVKVLLHMKDQREATVVVKQIEHEVWLYLFVRTMTNVGVAFIVSIMLWMFGLPNPILWGVMAGILEFIPFIGAFISTIVILLISLLTFENPWYILLPPFAFSFFISLEGNLFVPYLLGRSMTLNQVAIVLSIFLFGWLWGVMGSFLSVPLLMTCKIILDNLNKDNFMNELLEE